MRRQIKLTFQIGFNATQTASNVFRFQIARDVSRVCGGCTTSFKDGWWMSDGASHAQRFKGDLQRETCLEVELTCELAKVDAAYNAAKDAITDAALRYGIETDWVHVSETEMTGRHFSVAAHAFNRGKAAA